MAEDLSADETPCCVSPHRAGLGRRAVTPRQSRQRKGSVPAALAAPGWRRSSMRRGAGGGSWCGSGPSGGRDATGSSMGRRAAMGRAGMGDDEVVVGVQPRGITGGWWGQGRDALPKPCLRLLASVPALPRNLQPGLPWGPWGGHRPVPAATARRGGQGCRDVPRDATRFGGRLGAPARGSDLKDGTWETRGGKGAGIWGPQGTAKADRALALRGLRPLPGLGRAPRLVLWGYL